MKEKISEIRAEVESMDIEKLSKTSWDASEEQKINHIIEALEQLYIDIGLVLPQASNIKRCINLAGYIKDWRRYTYSEKTDEGARERISGLKEQILIALNEIDASMKQLVALLASYT